MKKNTTYEKIEAYLLNRLPPGERADFEKEIDATPELSEAVDILRDTIKAAGEEDIKAFRRELELAAAGNSGRQGGALLSFRWVLAAAAMVVLAVGIWLLTSRSSGPAPHQPIVKEAPPQSQPQEDKQTDEQQKPPITPSLPASKKPEPAPKTNEYVALTAELYTPYDASGIRSGGQEEPADLSDFQSAADAYNNKDWKQVIRLLPSPSPDQLTESLKLRAHAYFQLGDYDNAAADFQQLTENSIIYKYDAEWNLLLCYLARLPGKREAFERIQAQILANAEHPFYHKAVDLQGKVK